MGSCCDIQGCLLVNKVAHTLLCSFTMMALPLRKIRLLLSSTLPTSTSSRTGLLSTARLLAPRTWITSYQHPHLVVAAVVVPLQPPPMVQLPVVLLLPTRRKSQKMRNQWPQSPTFSGMTEMTTKWQLIE